MDDREAYEFYLDPAHREPAGPGRKRKRTTLSSQVPVRFSPEVIEAVKAAAHEEGVTVSSWIRRLVRHELDVPETIEMTADGVDGPLRLPADALRAITAAVMPALIQHGQVSLVIGTPRAGAERPAGIIPGSGRMGELKALPSSLSFAAPRTFTCPHLSIGGVLSASCATCGPLPAAA